MLFKTSHGELKARVPTHGSTTVLIPSKRNLSDRDKLEPPVRYRITLAQAIPETNSCEEAVLRICRRVAHRYGGRDVNSQIE